MGEAWGRGYITPIDNQTTALLFAFSIIHGSVCIKCKPKNKKWGRPGDEATLHPFVSTSLDEQRSTYNNYINYEHWMNRGV